MKEFFGFGGYQRPVEGFMVYNRLVCNEPTTHK